MRHISVDAPREGSMTSRRKGKGKKDGWGRYDEDQGMFDSQEEWDSPMQQISMELQAEGRKKMKPKVKQRYRGENIVMQLLELPVLQQIASCGVDGNVLALEVPARRTGEFLKRLAAHLLNLPRRKNVEPATTSSSKMILLARSFSNIGHLPSEREWLQEQVTSGAVKLSAFQVTLGYDHFTAEEVLRKLLPQGIEIPSSFEQAGHIAHLNLRDSQLPYKGIIGQVILDKNKSAVKTVVNKTGKIETEFRTFPMEHLAGETSTVVRLKEHQCFFEFEYRDVYWNSRLQEELQNMFLALFLQPSSIAAASHPVVADCTCGVGPFSIPMVKLTNGLVSHANDLNPSSIHWLKKSVEMNKLPQVIEVDQLPVHGPDFAASLGSLLVIHKPNDARKFVPDLFKKRHPVTHAIFNLPAMGVELLDCFRGLDYVKQNLPRPLVCCYTFSLGSLQRTAPLH
eukprot:symbB.v1.2.014933.t6/scaffold1103.1/size137753/9